MMDWTIIELLTDLPSSKYDAGEAVARTSAAKMRRQRARRLRSFMLNVRPGSGRVAAAAPGSAVGGGGC